MSSSYVRTQIKNFITTNFPAENIIDLTGQYLEIKDFLAANSLTYESNWLGIDFIGSDETPITVGASNTTGCYREDGSLFFHVVEPIKIAAASNILTRTEALRNGLRGQRIGDIIIESVTPLSTTEGSTLQFSGGFTSGSFIINYYRDLNL